MSLTAAALALGALSAGAQAYQGYQQRKAARRAAGRGPAQLEDPYRSLRPMAAAQLRSQMRGQLAPGMDRAVSEAVRRPYAEAMSKLTRGMGPAAAGNLRQQMLQAQASELARARAGLYQQAASGQRSALERLLAQRPSDLNLQMQDLLSRQQAQLGASQFAGAGVGALGEGAGQAANLAMLLQLLGESK